MARIIYKGSADIRTLNAADLKAHGVEGFRHTEFARGDAYEVDQPTADLLTSRPDIFGAFEIAPPTETSSTLEQSVDEPARAAKTKST